MGWVCTLPYAERHVTLGPRSVTPETGIPPRDRAREVQEDLVKSAPQVKNPFQSTPSPEPHAVRRRAILAAHPDIRDLFGPDRRMIGVLVGVTAAHFGIAAALARYTDPSWPLGSALAVAVAAGSVGAVLSHWASMFIHEASHDHCAESPVENRLWAIFASVSLGLPAAMTFRKYHRRHHAWLGVRGVDADLPLDCEARLIASRRPAKVAWFVFFLASYLARGWRNRSPIDRWEALNALVVIATNALVWWALGPAALGYLLLSALIGHSVHPVAAHFVHEHFVFSEGQETNSYYGILNLVTFNVGYHVEHHDLPAIAGTRLPEYHARTKTFYEHLASDTCWAEVMWRFVRDPSVGMASRVVRGHPTGQNRPEGLSFPSPRLLIAPDGRRLGYELRRGKIDLDAGDTWSPLG